MKESGRYCYGLLLVLDFSPINIRFSAFDLYSYVGFFFYGARAPVAPSAFSLLSFHSLALMSSSRRLNELGERARARTSPGHQPKMLKRNGVVLSFGYSYTDKV